MYVSRKMLAVFIGIILAVSIPLQCSAQSTNESTDFPVNSKEMTVSEDILVKSNSATNSIMDREDSVSQKTSGEDNNDRNENEIKSFAAHTHTNDCYSGHRHTINCNYVYNVPAEGVSAFYLRVDGNYYQLYSTMELRDSSHRLVFKLLDNHYTSVFSVTEYRNGSIYYHKELSYGTGYYGDPVYINTRKQLYECFNWLEASRKLYLYENRGVGIYAYPGIDIPPQIKVSCPQAQDETPKCNLVVTSITPTNPTQTIKRGENIITTATATFLDGHTGVVYDCTNNLNSTLEGTRTVTLTYSGAIDNAKTPGTKTWKWSRV